MKKILLLIISFSFVGGFAQNFDQYFLDKTLRINYLHIGKNDTERIEIDSYYHGGKWYGTRSFLIEPNRYGDMLFEVFDDASQQLIFLL